MGLIIFLIQKCTEHCKTKDDDEYQRYNICDPDYNSLKKKEGKVDGLDCYRYASEGCWHLSVDIIRCPLCKYHLPKQEEEKITNLILNSSERAIYNQINNYHDLIRDVYKVDIFDTLAEINTEIDRNLANVDDNIYYRHICRRSNFKEIIIDIRAYDKGFNYKSLIYKPYAYENWGNNPSAKKRLLDNRQIAYDEQIRIDELNRIYEEKRSRKNEIENYYQNEFDLHCFEQDRYNYERAKDKMDRDFNYYNDKIKEINEYINSQIDYYNRDIERQISAGGYDDHGQPPPDWNAQFEEEKKRRIHFYPDSLLQDCLGYAKYYYTKEKIREYFEANTPEKTTGSYNIRRSDEEYDEFIQYIRERTSEYDQIIIYLDTHEYPLKNRYLLSF